MPKFCCPAIFMHYSWIYWSFCIFFGTFCGVFWFNKTSKSQWGYLMFLKIFWMDFSIDIWSYYIMLPNCPKSVYGTFWVSNFVRAPFFGFAFCVFAVLFIMYVCFCEWCMFDCFDWVHVMHACIVYKRQKKNVYIKNQATKLSSKSL